MRILENELVGKEVMNVEGFLIGVVKDSLKNEATGETRSILVKPSKETEIRLFNLDDEGNIIFPYSSVATVKSHNCGSI